MESSTCGWTGRGHRGDRRGGGGRWREKEKERGGGGRNVWEASKGRKEGTNSLETNKKQKKIILFGSFIFSFRFLRSTKKPDAFFFHVIRIPRGTTYVSFRSSLFFSLCFFSFFTFCIPNLSWGEGHVFRIQQQKGNPPTFPFNHFLRFGLLFSFFLSFALTSSL